MINAMHPKNLHVVFSLITARIGNHMLNKVWDDITYPFANFNGCIVEVWEWISNFMPPFKIVM